MASKAEFQARENLMAIRRRRQQEEARASSYENAYAFKDEEDPEEVARRNLERIRGRNQEKNNTNRLEELRRAAKEREENRLALERYKSISGIKNEREIGNRRGIGDALDERLQRSQGLTSMRPGSERLERTEALRRMEAKTEDRRLFSDDFDRKVRRDALAELKKTVKHEKILGNSKTLEELARNLSKSRGEKVTRSDAYQMVKNEIEKIDNMNYEEERQKKRKRFENIPINRKDFEELAEAGRKKAEKNSNPIRATLDKTEMEGSGTPDIFTRTEHEKYLKMSEEERKIFGYYIETQGEKKAKEYLRTIERDLNEREMEKAKERISEFAEEHPVLASVASIPVGWLKGGGIAAAAVQEVKNAVSGKDVPVDINSRTFWPSQAQEALRGTVQEDMGNIGEFLYGTGMSMADFLSMLPTGPAALPLMATGAATDKAREVIERGGSNAQAVKMGLTAGAAEMISEKIGLDRLAMLAKAGAKAKKQFVKQVILEGVIPEGLEEVFSDIVNNVADDKLMQDMSEKSIKMQQYIGRGMSREEAQKRVFKERVMDSAMSFAGGALAGGIMGGGAYGAGYARADALGDWVSKQTDLEKVLMNTAKQMKNTKSSEMSSELEGKELSNYERGMLYSQVSEDMKSAEPEQKKNMQEKAPDIRAENQEMIPFEEIENEEMYRKMAQETVEREEKRQEKRQERNILKGMSEIGKDEAQTKPQREVSRFRASINYNGATGEVTGIDRVENGKIFVRVNTGSQETSQPIDRVDFEDAGTERLYRTAENYGNAGARNFILEYKGGDLENYRKGYDSYYKAALVEFPKSAVSSPYGDMLTFGQQATAYEAGVADRDAALQKKINTYGQVTKGTGTFVDKTGKVSDQDTRALSALAKASGATIVVEDTLDKDANGYYRNGEVHISANADNPAVVVAKHELTHYILEQTPHAEEYKTYVGQKLMEQNGESLEEIVQHRIDLYQKNGVTLSYDEALDEVVANASEMFLTDETSINSLAEENPGLASKILDFVRNLIKDIKDAMKGYSPKSREAQMLNENLETAQEAERLWVKAIREAKKNAERGKEEVKEIDGIKFSVKESFADQVDRAMKGEFSRYDALYVSGTPEILQKIGMRNLPVLYTQNHLKKAVQGKDNMQHTHGLTVQQVKKLPEYIKSPAIIMDSATRNDSVVLISDELDDSGNPIIVAIKANGKGQYLSAEIDSNFVTSMYGKDGFKKFIESAAEQERIVYVNKEKSLKLSKQFALVQFQRAVSSFGFDTIIHKSNNIVNEMKKDSTESNDKKFSLKEMEDGTKYVSVDVEQERFDKLSVTEMRDEARKVLKEKFQGKKMPKGTTITGKSIKKFGNSYSPDTAEAKFRESTEIENVIEISEYLGHSDEERLKRGHEGIADYGWDYYRTRFEVAGRMYEGQIDVGLGKERDTLYNVSKIKDITNLGPGNTRKTDFAGSSNDIFNNNIPDSEGNNNEKFSLKETSETDYEVLKEENQDLKEMNSILGGMIKAARGMGPDRESIQKVGRKILRDYHSDYSLNTFTENMEKLWNYIAYAKNVNADDVAAATAGMAKEILARSMQDTNKGYAEQYKDLVQEVRRTKLAVMEEYRGDFDQVGGYGAFRKKNFGTLQLGKEGVNVDSYYQSLAERYGELFDETVYTNPADQLIHIAEVMESMKPKYANAYGMDMDEAAADLAHQIYQSYFDIEAEKGSIDAIRKGVIEKEREKYKKYRENYREKFKQMKAEYRGNFMERRRENFEKKRYSQNIEKTANRMSKWLLSPTNANHVPEILRGPVAEFLNTVNLSSRDTNVYGDPTKRTLKWQALSRAYDSIIKAQNDGAYAGEYIEMDPDLKEMLDELIKRNESVLLADMDLKDMKELNRLILAVKKSIESANELLSTENYKRASDLGDRFIEENNGKKAKDSAYKAANIVRNFMTLDMIDARTYFHSMGDASMDIYGALRKGMDKKTQNIKTAHDYIQELIGKTDVKEWSGEKARLKTYELESGEKISLTDAQAMSLYRLLQREQAREHILKGGIVQERTVTKIGRFKKGVSKSDKPVRVTEKDLIEITNSLSEEQKRIADGITKFFTDTTSAWGNEVSMQLYGYRKFNARNYFPIVSDNSFTSTQSGDQQRSVQTLKNMGSTKSTVPHAGNPIIVQDIFDVYARQADQMASYNAFVVPLTDLQKWYNYQGAPDAKYTESVKQTIKKAMGENGRAYLDTLIRRINGVAEKETAKSIPSLLTSNMKSAAIGANLRVVLQQPTAVVRAAMVIDSKYLAKGMAKRADTDLMKKYAPIAQWKDWGYFEMDTGRQMKDVILGNSSIKDKAMEPAGMADNFTWGKIWNAAVLETKEKTDLKFGTEEFYEAAGKRFSDIIDRTQVVDSILHRSSAMIQKDSLTKMATSFMSEPIKTYNMVYDTLMNTGGKKETSKELAKLFVILTVQNAVNALAQTLADTWRDDDKETAWWDEETWKKNFVGNMNPLGYIPFLKEIPSMLEGFSAERQEMTGVSDAVTNWQKWKSYFAGDSKHTAAGLVREAMKPFSELTGIPLHSAAREIESLGDITAWAFRKITGNNTIALEYEVKKVYCDPSYQRNRTMFIAYYAKAREAGENDVAVKIYNDLLKAGNTREQLDDAYENWKKRSVTEEEAELTEAMGKAYLNGDMETYQEVMEEMNRKGMDVGKALDRIGEEKEEKGEEDDYITEEYLEKEEKTESIYPMLYMALEKGDAEAQKKYRKQLRDAGEEEDDIQEKLLKEQNRNAKMNGDVVYSYEALYETLVNEGKSSNVYREIENGLKKYGKNDAGIKRSLQSKLKKAYLNSRGNDELTKKYYSLLKSIGTKDETIKGWLK